MGIYGFVFSFLSLLVGIVATVIVSRYYFNRSTDKALTPYLDFSSQLLSGIDPEVKKDLSIKYQDVEVDDILQIQYLIANTGEKAIRDIIKPLTLSIPDGEILDASLLHIYPEGREVNLDVSDDKRSVQFLFPLLNKSEFFMVKLLIRGVIPKKDIHFSISVDDLPPALSVERLSREKVVTTEGDSSAGVDKSVLLMGTIFLIFGSSIIYLGHLANIEWPSFNIDSPAVFFQHIKLMHIAETISDIACVFMLITGALAIVFSLEGVSFRKKNKYLIPGALRHSAYSGSYSVVRLKEELEELEKLEE